ncbi:MAG: RHS repeat protein [Nanoarchaeota archaeon]|nr:RHS repeat protein [Nanoarchaeota archaeon]
MNFNKNKQIFVFFLFLFLILFVNKSLANAYKYECMELGGVYISEPDNYVYDFFYKLNPFLCCGDDSAEHYDSTANICCLDAVWNAAPANRCCDYTKPLSASNCGVAETVCSPCSATATVSCYCSSGCKIEERTQIYPGRTCGGAPGDCSTNCDAIASTACKCPSTCFNAGNIIDVGETCGGKGFAVSFTYNYDLSGNLLKVTTPGAKIIRSQYDSIGRLVWSQNSDTGQITFEYDLLGNMIGSTNANSKNKSVTYDLTNRIKRTYTS